MYDDQPKTIHTPASLRNDNDVQKSWCIQIELYSASLSYNVIKWNVNYKEQWNMHSIKKPNSRKRVYFLWWYFVVRIYDI